MRDNPASPTAPIASGPAYFTRYEHLRMHRSASGILTVRLTTNNGPIVFTGKDRHDFVEAFS